MRILDGGNLKASLDDMGFDPGDFKLFTGMIKRPNGIILVTGPTGSGKTTTLYATLNSLNTVDRKIMTAEDPVEYNLNGVNQCQVHSKIGLDFPRILRAMLRQAPNVILVGEIRDEETARIAIQASLTGHLVFSTLHTNDAPSSITRLIDMNVQPFLVATSIQAVLAQRLVRKNCPKCLVPFEPEKKQLLALGLKPEQCQGRTFMRGKGCDHCKGSGYRGRGGIFELMVMNKAIRDLAFNKATASEIRKAAVANGMATLAMDGARKALQGFTTPEEVLRMAKAEDQELGG
jgi:type IV pilus assembly protein PilB